MLKLAPTWSKMAPKWPQDGPKTAQDGTKTAQDGPKMAPRRPKTAYDGIKKSLKFIAKNGISQHEAVLRLSGQGGLGGFGKPPLTLYCVGVLGPPEILQGYGGKPLEAVSGLGFSA